MKILTPPQINSSISFWARYESDGTFLRETYRNGKVLSSKRMFDSIVKKVGRGLRKTWKMV